MTTQSDHVPVLLNEAVDALNIRADGIYIDGTFGRGGHSQLILDRLGEQGRLFAFDKDQAAIDVAQRRFGSDPRFSITHDSFVSIPRVVAELGLERCIDGLLLDLGVSSPQLDEAERGFSFMNDGPLDMRMDRTRGMTAAEWLNTADEADIASVIKEYGEERFGKRIAHAIVNQRVESPLQTTAELARLVDKAAPVKERHKHPATRTFQAVRIFINRELDDIKDCLRDSLGILAKRGRLSVISFHSLEDRIVKHFMRDQARGPQLPKGLPVVHTETRGAIRLIGKAIKAGDDELKVNPRARSAVLRVAEVLA